MTTLSPSKIAEIEKEAFKAYPEDIVDLDEYPFTYDANSGNRSIYTAGATAQALKSLEREKKLVEALEELVKLKRYKDKVGKDFHYNERQPIAWEKAETALKQYNESL